MNDTLSRRVSTFIFWDIT